MFTQKISVVAQRTNRHEPILQTTGDEQTLVAVPPPLPIPGKRSVAISPQTAAASGLAQTFGLDFRAAILTVIVDLMLFGGDLVSVGMLIPFALAVAAVHGFIVYRIQRKWYGDDHESALIKALIIAMLTAIPAPLSPIIAVPGGILGIVKAIRRK